MWTAIGGSKTHFTCNLFCHRCTRPRSFWQLDRSMHVLQIMWHKRNMAWWPDADVHARLLWIYSSSPAGHAKICFYLNEQNLMRCGLDHLQQREKNQIVKCLCRWKRSRSGTSVRTSALKWTKTEGYPGWNAMFAANIYQLFGRKQKTEVGL